MAPVDKKRRGIFEPPPETPEEMRDALTRAGYSGCRTMGGCLAATVVIAFVIVVCVVLLAMCSGGEDEVAAKGVAGVAGVSKVDRYEDVNLFVEAKLPTAWDDKGYVDRAALLVADTGRAIQKGAPDATPVPENVVFSLSTDGTNAHGEEIEIDFLTLRFASEDLQRARFDNLMPGRVLNLAREVSWGSAAGAKAIGVWCAEPDNLADGRKFCSSLLR